MKDSFGRELLTISLLTAASIFLVVMLTFRQLVVPAILVLLVQCGVFLTVSTTWLGATPSDIEKDIAKRIEDAVAGVDGLKHIECSCM